MLQAEFAGRLISKSGGPDMLNTKVPPASHCVERQMWKLELLRRPTAQIVQSHAKDEHEMPEKNAVIADGDRMKYWDKTGALGEGFWGSLFGSVFFAIPGLRPLLVAGLLWIGPSRTSGKSRPSTR